MLLKIRNLTESNFLPNNIVYCIFGVTIYLFYSNKSEILQRKFGVIWPEIVFDLLKSGTL